MASIKLTFFMTLVASVLVLLTNVIVVVAIPVEAEVGNPKVASLIESCSGLVLQDDHYLHASCQGAFGADEVANVVWQNTSLDLNTCIGYYGHDGLKFTSECDHTWTGIDLNSVLMNSGGVLQCSSPQAESSNNSLAAQLTQDVSEGWFSLTCGSWELIGSDLPWDISPDPYSLRAWCKIHDNPFQTISRLDLNECFENINGGMSWTANGLFQQTCNKCHLENGVQFHCSCSDQGSFDHAETIIDLTAKITNDHGVLRCFDSYAFVEGDEDEGHAGGGGSKIAASAHNNSDDEGDILI